jgi:hypothetical protein
MPRWVEDWPRVKRWVHEFWAQFAHGSVALLHYVGSVGKGKLATVINSSGSQNYRIGSSNFIREKAGGVYL